MNLKTEFRSPSTALTPVWIKGLIQLCYSTITEMTNGNVQAVTPFPYFEFSYNWCVGHQDPEISASVHLTNGIVSWWPLSDGNDLHSFTSWLGVTGLQILCDCRTWTGSPWGLICATLERAWGSGSQENKHQNKATQGRGIKWAENNMLKAMYLKIKDLFSVL